jgi:hypothetical protein
MSWKFMFGENIEVFKRIQELNYVEENFKYLETWTWIFYDDFIVWQIFAVWLPKNFETLEILLI